MATKLDGCWRRVQSEDTDSTAEDIIIEFTSDGSLIYTILEQGSVKKILLRYSICGDEIITDQPSAPRIERTRFRLDGRKIVLQKDDHTETFEEIERETANQIIAQSSRLN